MKRTTFMLTALVVLQMHLVIAQGAKPQLMDAPCNAVNSFSFHWSFSDEIDKVVSYPIVEPNGIFIWDFERQKIRRIINLPKSYANYPIVVWKKNGDRFYFMRDSAVMEFDFESGALTNRYQALFPIHFAAKISEKNQLLIGGAGSFSQYEVLDMDSLHPVIRFSLPGAEAVTSRLIISSDGKYLAQNFTTNQIHIVDLQTGAKAATIDRVFYLSPIAFTNDNQEIAVANSSKYINFYDLKTGKKTRELSAPQHDEFKSLRFSNDGRFLIATGGSCYIWDLRQNRVIFSGNGGSAGAFFMQNDSLLCVPGDQKYKSLNIYDFNAIISAANSRFGPAKAAEHVLKASETPSDPVGKPGGLFPVCPIQSDFTPLEIIRTDEKLPPFSFDGIQTNDTRLTFKYGVWDRRVKKMTHHFVSDIEQIGFQFFNPDTHDLVFLNETLHPDGYTQHVPYHINLSSGRPARPLFSEPRKVAGAFFSAKGGYVAHHAYDKSTKNFQLYDLRRQTNIQAFELFKDENRQGNGLGAVQFFKNGQKILAKCFQMDSVEFQHVLFYALDCNSGKIELLNKKTDFEDYESDLTIISPNERFFVEPNMGKQVVVFNIETKEIEFIIPQDAFYVLDVQFSPDEKILSLEDENSIKLYSIAEKKLWKQFYGSKPLWRPQRKELSWYDRRHNALVWSDLNHRQDTIRLAGPYGRHFYTLDGKFLFVLDEDGTLKKIDADNGQVIHSRRYASLQKSGYLPKIVMGEGYFFASNQLGSGLDFYAVDNLERICTYYPLSDDDWAVVSETGHFEGSENAYNKLYFSDGQIIRTLDRFPAEFRYSGLLRHLLNGSRLPVMDPGKTFLTN